MQKERILILDEKNIDWKLQRMAYQIWERNSNEQNIILIGIENGGKAVAESLAARLRKISPLSVELISLKINKKQVLQNDTVKMETSLTGRAVVVVDDVTNSGKTLTYALKPLLAYEPASLMVAVLVDRQHKSFPVSPDIVGHTVATTLQEHIEVECNADGSMQAYLL